MIVKNRVLQGKEKRQNADEAKVSKGYVVLCRIIKKRKYGTYPTAGIPLEFFSHRL
jgi:hypothetical protein